MKAAKITCLFLDIGGVLLTNGWDQHARKLAAKTFKLDWDDMQDRHRLIFEAFERGQFTLKEYLDLVIFYKKRPFTQAQFRKFMFAQSNPYPEMLNLIRQLKAKYGLKIIIVSNEALELNTYRIEKFKLNQFVDSYVSSCLVNLHKPEPDIFRLAINISQVPLHEIVYIENTPMFVQIAKGLGLQTILHTDYSSTQDQLCSFGLRS